MAGTPGNPNHDPKTGKFASASGLNRSNSTIGQRGKSRVKEHVSNAKAYIAGAAGVAAAGVGMAILQGVTKPTRMHATHITNYAQKAAIAKAKELAATHGPTISKALRSGTSTLMNHVKNMKAAGAIQHQPMQKPKIRVPMGTTSPKPKIRVPMGRK